ncbi:ABC transporter ATP-binding protein [Acidaminobacter sp. JC074]|uniref:ATP-binding cassette domain-containing protein n=1 Tax=Acidaminobacter sp. JC074 TaxID=2530199 RepID=UPI001F0E20D9|nr:ABC transporter ATP-binding protein [Acidaminobacter sp. JC074]
MIMSIVRKSLKYKGLFILVNVLLIIVYACEMLIPYMFSQFVDNITLTGTFSVVLEPVLIITLALVVLLIASFIKHVYSEYLISKVNNDFLDELDKKLESLPLKVTQKENPSYLNRRLFNDIITAVTFVHENFSVAIIMSLSSLVLLGLIASIQKLMLPVVFLAVFINTLGILVFHKLIYKRGYEYREIHNLYYSSNNDRLSNIKETKIHAWYDISGHQVNQNFNNLLNKGIQVYKVMASISNIGTLSKNISLILSILLGGYLFTLDKMSIGQLILVSTYTNMCLINTESFLKLGQEYQHAKVSYNRLHEFLDMPDEANGDLVLEDIHNLEIKDLSFSYDESKRLISSLDLVLTRGKIYCLKGKNGHGKTTLVDLILGLNHDYCGAIRYNGHELKDLDMRHARKHLISVVLQEPQMQRISVKDNLYRGLQTSSDDKAVFDIEEILDLEDAQTLSGGEKQKIAVLRALLKGSEVLILDEPVSAMDAEGIRQLKNELQAMKSKKIILLISHNEEVFDIVDEFIEIKDMY